MRVGAAAGDVGGRLPHVAPVSHLRDLEAKLVEVALAALGSHLGALIIPDVADPLEEEEERQDVADAGLTRLWAPLRKPVAVASCESPGPF